MDLSTYISRISFRFMRPDTVRPPGYGRVSRMLDRVGVHPEVLNTQLPPTDPAALRALTALCRVPRMSTFAIGATINHAVSAMPGDQKFVNVGVWNGFTFLAGLVNNPTKRCVGIDNFSRFGGPRRQFMHRFETCKTAKHDFFDLDYVDYFAHAHEGQIGFYIYDGRHAYEDQLNGLSMAEKFFSDTCLILVDDTNLEAPRQATLDFIAGSQYSYEMLFDQRTAANAHPTFWNGVMLFRRTSAAG
jgi:hypothetical protein